MEKHNNPKTSVYVIYHPDNGIEVWAYDKTADVFFCRDIDPQSGELDGSRERILSLGKFAEYVEECEIVFEDYEVIEFSAEESPDPMWDAYHYIGERFFLTGFHDLTEAEAYANYITQHRAEIAHVAHPVTQK